MFSCGFFFYFYFLAVTECFSSIFVNEMKQNKKRVEDFQQDTRYFHDYEAVLESSSGDSIHVRPHTSITDIFRQLFFFFLMTYYHGMKLDRIV